jgi:hypothetical protein
MAPETLQEMISLLNDYGNAKFGDDWWPGDAYGYLSDKQAARLSELIARNDE